MRDARSEVIYCGFESRAGAPDAAVGGFVTGTRRVVGSALFAHTRMILSPCTHPGEGSLPWRFVEDCRRLGRMLRAHPDAHAVLIQVGYYRSTYRELALAELARRAGRRVVLDVRGGAVLHFLDRESDAITRKAFRRLLGRADRVLVQCASTLPELRRRHPGVRFEWFPNFVPTTELRAVARPERRPGQPLRAVYFGSYQRTKGISEMLQAVTALRQEDGKDVELHLAGAGRDVALAREIADRASEGVIDHGAVGHDDLFALLDRMDVFVFPTSHFGEGHSNALNEAMMRGLAVIATPHHENPHVLPPETSRWLDPKDLVPSIRRELRFLAEHPEEIERLGDANRRWVEERFTDARWIPVLEGFLDELASSRIPGDA